MNARYTKYFYCYSPNLKDWFDSNGLDYISTDIHKTTQRRFWKYKSCRIIDILLEEYRKHLNK